MNLNDVNSNMFPLGSFELSPPSMSRDEKHGFSRAGDDGSIQRISEIDTEEFEKDNGPTVSGFSNKDFSDQEERIRSGHMGMSSPVDHLKSTPAGLMKQEIVDAIERGYEDLDRGTKIRVLKELVKRFELEGEERRANTKIIRR